MDKTTNTPQRRDLGINSLMIPLPQSSKYSDFQLECDGLSFPVHKIIVCSRSPVIGAAVDRGFKESMEGVFRVRGFTTSAVERMLQFMYTGDYASEEDEQCERRSDSASDSNGDKFSASGDVLQLHVEMNAIANFYAVSGLSSLANQKIAAILDNTNDWNAVSFSRFVETAYDISNDTDLSDISTSVAACHIDELMTCPRFKTVELPSSFYFDTLCKAMTRLKSDSERMRTKLDGLSTAFLGVIQSVNQGFCTICGHTFGCEIDAHEFRRFEIRCRNCGHAKEVPDSTVVRIR